MTTLDQMDLEAFFNIRQWLMEAIEARGAKVTGSGVGLGQADLDFVLEGFRYNVSVRPLLSRELETKPADQTLTQTSTVTDGNKFGKS